LLLLTAGLAVPAAAQAADPGYTAKNLLFTVNVGPGGKTTCTIDATLYTPTGVSAANPAPAMLATNGFGGSKHEFDKLAPAYAKRGYVFLAYSGLGFGGPSQSNPDPSMHGSGCRIELDDPDWDGKAASQLIDFLGGGHPAQDTTTVDYVIHDRVDHAGVAQAHDPRLGMIGGSYGGQIQFSAADVDRRLDTIVPQITWNDLSYSLAPNNTGFDRGVTYNATTAQGVEKYEWTQLFFGVGIADGVAGTLSGQDPSHVEGQCPNFDDQACKSVVSMDATGYPDAATLALARHASVSSYIKQITIPTFLAQGQVDTLFNLNESVATYEELRAQGTPVKMLWRSAGHSGGGLGGSEDNAGNPEAAYASRAYLEWFDYYLRGVGDPPTLDFSYYRDWVPFPSDKDAAPSVTTAHSYPVAPDQTWYLSGTDALVADSAAVKAGSAQFAVQPQAPASYSETSEFDQSQAVRDTPGTFAAYSTPPLAQDTDVVGIPRLTIKLDAPTFAQSQQVDPAGRLVLFAKLYDVAPDGAIVLPHRLIAPIRVPDVGRSFSVTLPGIAHRFLKQHTMELVLASSDAAYRNNTLAGPVTVTVDPKAPPALDLPVLGAGTPPAPVAAPAGTQSPGAGVQPQVLTEGSSNSAAQLPRPAPGCTGKRSLRIHLRFAARHGHGRILWAKLSVNGHLVKTLRREQIRGGYLLRGLPRRKTFRVTVVEKTSRGRLLRSARTYNRGCH
jgi:ABC-2 type transport system ATP-binding protein